MCEAPALPPIARLAAHLTGRYRLDAELGSGGMALVNRALDLRHDRPVAIKVLRPELAADFREQARLEAGDTVTATRALRRYVAMRSDPEPSVRLEVDRARWALSALVSR